MRCMSIRFAAPVAPQYRHILIRAVRRSRLLAANDNLRDGPAQGEGVFRAALRHFSAHGLAAATEALKAAEQARADGDETGFAWWNEICRTLDRRLAARLEQQAETGS